MKYPIENYPTILKGAVWADTLRLECLDGSEMYFKPELYRLNVGVVCRNINGNLRWDLEDVRPFEFNGKIWGVTHLQKKSKRGWMKVSPDCYHWWWFWKLQEPGKPGSERGIYFRKPFSWRWDVAGTMIDGILRHWIWTKGFLGGHWD